MLRWFLVLFSLAATLTWIGYYTLAVLAAGMQPTGNHNSPQIRLPWKYSLADMDDIFVLLVLLPGSALLLLWSATWIAFSRHARSRAERQ